MFGIGCAKKCALVMIEPPGQVWMGSILKVDDDVEIAVEETVFEELISAMCQTRIHKSRIRIELALQKASYIRG
jgi:hypothetical protein